MPDSSSHRSPTKPTPLLALIALAVAHRHQPAWLAVDLGDAASSIANGPRPERLSRLCSRAIGLFEPVVVALTLRGRPRRDSNREARDADLCLTRALLETATSILRHVGPRQRGVRELVVGAWLRLKEQHALTQEHFADALGVPARTLRAWLRDPPARPGPKPKPAKKDAPPPARPRGPRRPRFGFDITLPGLQEAADTTDLAAFGVPLKLIATQDVGGRDQDLFDAIIVEDHESADLVVKALREALKDKPGAQAITDQGTPYMAEVTREALAGLEVEHAPQKEAHPQGKATIERAFGSAKSIARPLLSLTDRLADCFPALRDPALAKALASLVLVTILRAYQAGARAARRADEARAFVTDEALARVAEEARARARADDRSARLLLGHIFECYGLPGSRPDFINTLRGYPVEVLQAAERGFRQQVHRGDIEDRRSYFAAIVRKCNEEHRRHRALQRHHDELADSFTQAEVACAVEEAERRADPVAALRGGLEGLLQQWQPSHQALLADGAGVPRAVLRTALQRLVDLCGTTSARDALLGARRAFVQAHATLEPTALEAIDRVLAELLSATHHQRGGSTLERSRLLPLEQTC